MTSERKILWAPWRESYVVQYHSGECIFCKALNQDDATNHVVYRSRYSIALLNRYPYNNGHVMIAPTRHVPSFEMLSDDELLDLVKTVSIVLKALRNCYNPQGFNIGANIGKAAGAGIEGHLHIHVVPRWNGDTNFMPVIANAKVIPEDLNASWRKIRSCLEKASSE
ncbi:HIT domain-containing protein [Ignisphaera sp. 4213-co]|uniref:HIT domain-containing protein n=1 Tax=Ignisphaera cupida TaxID=3050454 RepID=A0ABD4Z5T3_9CREN|nr:HIT domain-containing protein [Ignisphaera sp. 4213-co]MDK6028303.1 HIT domain-containing protein [Ignisphaera sp. 4213-co]